MSVVSVILTPFLPNVACLSRQMSFVGHGEELLQTRQRSQNTACPVHMQAVTISHDKINTTVWLDSRLGLLQGGSKTKLRTAERLERP